MSKISLKTIKAVWGTMDINEEIPEYLQNATAILSSRDISDLFGWLRSETKEHMICIHMDSKNRIICVDTVSTGSLTASIVHPREVFKAVLLSSATSIALVHNHPSGDTEPSREDLSITKIIKKGADLLGVKFLDHVIIGDDYCSLADRGLVY